MTDLEKVWNYCEQRKNDCDKNVEEIGIDNMLTPPWQTNMGMSNAYWSVQKVIEDIWEENEQIAEWLEDYKHIKQWKSDVMDDFCRYDASSCEELIANARNKAIDDFASKLIMHFADWELSNAPFNDDETDGIGEIICETIENAIGGVEEIAEQLKAGERE